MNRHPFTEFLEPLVPEFEELTGINVTLEVFPEDQFRQRRLLEASSGANTLDGYMIMPGQVGAQYLGAGWVRYIDDFVDDPLADHARPRFGRLLQRGHQHLPATMDRLFGLPLQIESSLLFYRERLAPSGGLRGSPPRRWKNFASMRTYAQHRRGRRLCRARQGSLSHEPDCELLIFLRRPVAKRERHLGVG